MSASSRIEQYLKDHPDGDLLVAVGYATAPGMAWLARRTVGRRVSLLIGDTRSQWWMKMSESDRAACLTFLRRGDVEIRNWYRTKRSRSGESSAHLKVWAVHNNWLPVSALVGSGNLTRKGLDDNVEVMVEAHGRDMQQAWDTARDVWGKAWPCADRLTEYLAGPDTPAGLHRDRPRPRARPRQARSATREGALRKRRRKQIILYVISGWFAVSGLTAGWQSGIGGVIWMLLIAGLFLIWARRSKN